MNCFVMVEILDRQMKIANDMYSVGFSNIDIYDTLIKDLSAFYDHHDLSVSIYFHRN